jgi:RNA polymerase sigma factor (sigma-70 family)
MVLGLCRLLLRDPVEAEDAAQQVFVSAHEALLRGSMPRDEGAWLAAIARNECRSRIRARMREPLALPELSSDLPDPLAAAIRATDLRAVWTALGTLPRRQRNALVLRELGGLSYHELGRALGISHSAVESLLFRARQRLRALLAGANAAAVPVALRDELMRLIPGFDPGSAGAVARVAALPVAWKLAGAAVSVGVVATGAGGMHHQSLRAHAAATKPTVAPFATHVVRAHARSHTAPIAAVSSFSSHRRRGREPEQEAEQRGRHRSRAEDVAEHKGSEGPGPAPAATVIAPVGDEPGGVSVSTQGPGGGGPERQLEAGEDESGSGDSGPGGGGGGGPDSDDSGHGGHSGPG